MKKAGMTFVAFVAFAVLAGVASADHDSSVFERVSSEWKDYGENAWDYHHGFLTTATSESGLFGLTYSCRSGGAWIKSGEPAMSRVLRLNAGLGTFAEADVRIRVGREIRRIRGTIENSPDDNQLALGSPDRVFGSATVSPATLVVEATVFDGFDKATVVLHLQTDGFYEVLAAYPACAPDGDA